LVSTCSRPTWPAPCSASEAVAAPERLSRAVRLAEAVQPPPLKAVQLFRKPDVATGQLIPVKEGLDALRSQREPFAIISAVGPTRTGKSSILGRAFLRGQNENAFEIGSGVTSHTGGVWMTNRPVSLRPSNGGKPIRCFIIDTEGFSGVGGLTSRTCTGCESTLFSPRHRHVAAHQLLSRRSACVCRRGQSLRYGLSHVLGCHLQLDVSRRRVGGRANEWLWQEDARCDCGGAVAMRRCDARWRHDVAIMPPSCRHHAAASRRR
jgi:hypothetical protein